MKTGPPPPMVKSLRPICLIKDYLFRCFLGLRRRAGRALLLSALCQLLPGGLELVRDDGLYESLEQRVGLHRPALELRMELAGNEPRVALQFHYLDERAVRGEAAELDPGLFELGPERVVHFKAVPVALAFLCHAVDRGGLRALFHGARVRPEPHGAALGVDRPLGLHYMDDRARGLRVALGRVRVLHPAQVPGYLYDSDLHADAYPEKRDRKSVVE